MTILCTELPWRIFDLGPNEFVIINYQSVNCLLAAATVAAVLPEQRGCVGRHLANRNELRVSGSDSLVLLFLLRQE